VIVLLTNDLMFQSRISGAVKAAGKSIMVQRAVESASSRIDSPETVEMVLIDLSLPLELASAVPAIRLAFPKSRILAYGAHVDVDRLAEAETAGVDQVLTRGQLDRDLNAIVSS
jgi:DNA-binding NarL/FixJ family response regulator